MAPPLFLLPFLLLTALSPSVLSAASNSTAFIRRSCAATVYPRLCFASLKPLASTIKHNPLTLALAAAAASLPKIRRASSQAAALRRGRAGRVGAALRDCVELLRTAAELTDQSIAAMRKLGPAARAGGPSFAWEASNAQTWMSAALTNEETCVDGFQGGEGVAVKAFLRKVGRVEKYTSNALALLNALVDG